MTASNESIIDAMQRHATEQAMRDAQILAALLALLEELKKKK